MLKVYEGYVFVGELESEDIDTVAQFIVSSKMYAFKMKSSITNQNLVSVKRNSIMWISDDFYNFDKLTKLIAYYEVFPPYKSPRLLRNDRFIKNEAIQYIELFVAEITNKDINEVFIDRGTTKLNYKSYDDMNHEADIRRGLDYWDDDYSEGNYYYDVELNLKEDVRGYYWTYKSKSPSNCLSGEINEEVFAQLMRETLVSAEIKCS